MGNLSLNSTDQSPAEQYLPLGYAGWIGRVADSDSVLVEVLYDCGAVPFVRTNVPQTLQVSLPRAHALQR